MDLPARIDREGYAVVPGVLDDGERSRLVEALGAIGSDPAALRRGGSLYGLRDIFRHVPEVRRVGDSPAVRALVEPVLGRGAFVARGLLFDKTEAANWSVPWHRDLTIAVRARRDVPGYGPWTMKAGVPHVQPPLSVLERMLTVRLHLDDCGPANGPLAVIPGSHITAGRGDEADRVLRRNVPAVVCPVGRGGALVMRPLILHASSAATEPGHRRVVHLEFAADPLSGGLEWAETPRA